MTQRSWSTPTDVLAKLQRRWDRGDLLTMFASGQEWVPLAIPLRSPSANDLGARFGEVQAWSAEWRQANQFRLETKTVGGRTIGVNELPDRACVDSYEQLWSVLRRTSEVSRFAGLLRTTKDRAPALADWMIARPLDVLRLQSAWEKLITTVLWIDHYANQDMYLRQVDVPGVDTKFIEGHRKVLAALLDRQLEEDRIDRSHAPAEFAARYRFRRKPGYVRFRLLDQHASGFSELTVRIDELSTKPLQARTVFVVENEVTYLAFPPVDESVVILGGGYALSQLEPLGWLSEREMLYWGDIDTHGFVILDRLRAKFGHVRSMLMDRSTLLAHEEHWVQEPTPATKHLEQLNPDEATLYHDLVEDTFGSAVRLEQERVSYSTIEHAVRRP
ncbi:DUF3322 domain-containing protein [Lentzea sp. NPDC102401]|uniref:DUF3322 domain-containing protein n=1 Tax=Lentzea sp. NPDC102401 TaxID=3364128 RepID=UPI003809029E